MNMSYCRFRNTVLSLEDCQDTLNNLGDINDLSPDEQRACLALIKICKEISEEHENLLS